MKLLHHWRNVDAEHAASKLPAHLLERELVHGESPKHIFGAAEVARLGVYWVAQEPIVPDKVIHWSCTKTETYVRVPLFPYDTSNQKPVHLCFGMTLGVIALKSFQQEVELVPLTLIQVSGSRMYPLTPTTDRAYLGIVFEVAGQYER